jgi:deoxyribodipyrimidine photo-lyase
VKTEDLSDIKVLLQKLRLEQQVPPVKLFKGGTCEAKGVLHAFLERFRQLRGHEKPAADEPCLAHAQILALRANFARLCRPGSPGRRCRAQYRYLSGRAYRPPQAADELRFLQPDYDTYSALPKWARKTLAEHQHDARDPAYTRAQLGAAETHDPYWKAAMRELKGTGHMHNYMRMYWGKKILKWSDTPEKAFETLLCLNNTYFLDGRDANSFANVAWVFGQHDRPWTERTVYGKVRYMSAGGSSARLNPKPTLKRSIALIAREKRLE